MNSEVTLMAQSNWKFEKPSPPGLVSDCIYANSIFVAVADNGAVGVSEDGIEWQWRASPALSPNPGFQRIEGVAFGNGKFVAVGNGGIVMTSEDGVDWALSSIGTNFWLAGVQFAQDLFVAVGKDYGNGGVVFTSPDGETWTRRDRREYEDLKAITYEADVFVAVGETGAIRHSSDGVNWIAVSSGTQNDLEDVSYGDDKFIAVGVDGVITRSVDGITWEKDDFVSRQYLGGIIYTDGGKFVVRGNQGVFWSTDGNNWTETSLAVSDYPDCIAHGRSPQTNDPIILLFGRESLQSSADLTTWVDRTDGSYEDFYGVTFRKNEFIANGYNSMILRSPDGLEWSDSVDPVLAHKDSWVFGKGVYVAAQNTHLSEGLHYSYNGETWNNTYNSSEVVVFDGNRFLSADDTGNVYSSSNGINWTSVATNVSGFSGSPTDLIYKDGLYIISFPNSILTSTDGITWTNRTFSLGKGAASLTCNDNIIVAVGSNIMTSTDGIQWVERASSSVNLQDIAYGGGHFVVVGREGIITTSSDGLAWTQQRSGTDESLEGVAYGSGRFVVVGGGGTVLSATSEGGGPPPRFLSLTSMESIAGTAFNHLIKVAEDEFTTPLPTVVFSAVDLPAGLILNPSSGQISGSAPEAGTYFLTITATTVFGSSEQKLRIDVTDQPPSWTDVHPRPLSHTLRHLIYDGSRYLGVTDYGTVAYSEDGTSWTKTFTGVPSDLQAIAQGGGIFVAVGDTGAAVKSNDLSGWDTVALETTSKLTGVAYGDSTYVVVGHDGFMATSSNGIDWTRIQQDSDEDFSKITYLNGQFIALTESYGSRVYISTDGIRWTDHYVAFSQEMSGVAYGAGKYLVMDYWSSSYYYSTTGVSWTRGHLSGGLGTIDVTWDGSKFVVLGSTEVFTSTDGITWETISQDMVRPAFSIVTGSDGILAAGANAVLLASGNGMEWDTVSSGSGQELSNLTYENGLYIASGGNRLLTSPDGFEWTPQDNITGATGFSRAATDVFYGAGQYFAWFAHSYGWADRVYTSNDGHNWTQGNFSATGGTTSFIPNEFIYANGSFVAVGDEGGVWTANDGLNWTRQDSGVTGDLQRVYWSDNQFIAIGGNGTIIVSPDAQTWTQADHYGMKEELRGLASMQGTYVAVGTNGLILRSIDGSNWDPVIAPYFDSFNDIAYDGEAFWVVGERGLHTSADGLTWDTFEPGNNLAKKRIIWDGERLLTVGEGEAIQSSTESISRPILSYGSTSPGYVGEPFTASAESGNFPATLSVNGVPPGISFDSNNGTFSGFPTEQGSFQSQVTATNAYGEVTAVVSLSFSNWIERESGLSAHLQDVAYGNGVFVAVGYSGALLSSVDGVVWTERDAATNSYILDVIYADGQFMAVTSGGEVIVSTDGIAWVARDVSAYSLGAICKGNGIYMAVGSRASISSDGITWSTVETGLSHVQYSVAYGNGRFVVGTSGGWASVSLDNGATWQNVSIGSSGGVTSMIFHDGEFIATQGIRILKSIDGLNWTQHEIEGGTSRVNDVTEHGGVLFMAGSSWGVPAGSLVYTTLDSSLNDPYINEDIQQLNGIVHGDGVTVAVGNSGAIVTSGVSYAVGSKKSSFTEDDASFLYQIVGSSGADSYFAYGLPSGLSLDSMTGVISGIPETAGEQTFTIGLTKNDITTTKEISLDVVSLYQWWQGQNFSPSERENDSIAGDTADFDGDGVTTILEFALGMNPKLADGNQMLSPKMVNVSGESYLGMSLKRPRYSYGEVNLAVECSADLSFSANTPAVQTGDIQDNLDGSDTWSFHFEQPAEEDARSGFMRIKAEKRLSTVDLEE